MFASSDHRHIGQHLDLFHFQEDAPGMVFWHPRGWRLFRVLEDAIRVRMESEGFREVRTPQLLRQPLWEQSGHWENFAQHMFFLEHGDGSGGGEVPAAVKPVSCPGHIQIVQRMALSHRQLPLRLCEFGLVHRNEPGGSLHGLFRLRQFTQDDGHIFCEEAQLQGEVERFCRSLSAFYSMLGFSRMSVAFSSRPPQRAGSDESWDKAEAALLAAAKYSGLECRMQPEEGAFYGPKLEFVLHDRSGREWQCGTIQLDFVLPERFDLRYADAKGASARPVMLHRAVFGSVERFLGILLEVHAEGLPCWLAPEQVRLVPVSPAQAAHAHALARRWKASWNVRVEVDAREENLSSRVSAAREALVPYVVVIGDREVAGGPLSVRDRGASAPRRVPAADFEAELARAVRPPDAVPVFED